MGVSKLLILAAAAVAQQIPDPDFHPRIDRPSFEKGKDPLVAIDEAHYNFHTATGRYEPFAGLLTRDGYLVRASKETFSANTLRGVKVLVVANALHESNASKWELPTPSAFTAEEIAALAAWIRGGGSLLLIADHMPFAGAASDLGKALGLEFTNGYVIKGSGGPDVLTKESGELADDPLTAGIGSVATFTGSAFQVSGPHRPLLKLGPGWHSVLAKTAGQLQGAPRQPVEGWLQGAVLTVGQGRVAVFGEAAMFSAQLAGPRKNPMGMNHPKAANNPAFLLSVMRWLSAAGDANR